ncbi:MAG: hypothetical protein NTU41_07720 [Chloroflexi bacterium]|nr:hypothetical protein [Chloroflexota bacterium]
MNSLEATRIVDELCEKLQDTQFVDFEKEDDLLAEVADIVSAYVSENLGELAVVWVEGRDRGKIKPVWAYGTEFYPDIAIEVADVPAVAISVTLAGREGSMVDPTASAIGQAIVYSVQYPYVIAFVLDRTESDLQKHWFDGEIQTRLWDSHRVTLIISQ